MTTARSRRRIWAAVSVAALAALTAACGSDTGSADAGSGSDAPTTTVTTTVAPTSATRGTGDSWASAELPPCDGLATFRTRPMWLPGRLPDGLVLASGGTEQYQSQYSSPSDTLTSTLVEIGDDGHVMSRIVITSGATWPGQAQPVSGTPTLDQVNGQPGSIALVIDRSNSPWVRATWTQGGVEWLANADEAVGVQGLADALGPMQLGVDEVVDPTGRYTVISEEPGSAGEGTAPALLTQLSLDPNASDVDPLVSVELRDRADGASGPGPDELGDELTALEVDDRWVVSSPMGASVGLPDGSYALARLRTSTALAQADPSASTSTLPGAVVLTQEDLREIVLGIVAADADAPGVGEVRIPSYWSELVGDIPLCGSGATD